MIQDPEKFSGNAATFDTWLPAIRAKLAVDGDAIGNSTAQFYYVYLNLESSVQAIVLPQLAHAENTKTWNPVSVIQQLRRVFENPNKVQEAEEKLQSHEQGKESLLVYHSKFERLLFEADASGWADAAKISRFRGGLSSTLKERLRNQLSLPDTYPAFVKIIQQLAGKSSSYSTFSAYQKPNTSAGTSYNLRPSQPTSYPRAETRQAAADPMDLSEVQVDLQSIEIGAINLSEVSAAPKSILRRPQPQPQPQPRLSTISAHKIAPYVSKATREAWRREGKCARCGSTYHWARRAITRQRNLLHTTPQEHQGQVKLLLLHWTTMTTLTAR